MGLLTNETTIVLNALSTKKDWKLAQEKLFESGYVPSKERAYELKNEIRKRINANLQSLPNLDDLILYTKKGLSETEKRKLCYVYLYYSDDSFMHMVDLLRDIDNSKDGVQIITRDALKKMLIDYQKALGKNPKEKTITNWIGRFISILRDIKIFVKKKWNVYTISFGLISRKNWTFFSLHAHFNNMDLIESPFF